VTLKRVCHIARGACAAIMIATVLAGCGGPAAAYRASVVSYTAPEPGDLNVFVRVTNIGTAAGTPTCTIDAKYQSGAGAGSNTGELSGSLAPGHSSMLNMLVAIPGEEIGNVTKVSASC
jgi:hypothetical protein